jgi:hypothetical protein
MKKLILMLTKEKLKYMIQKNLLRAVMISREEQWQLELGNLHLLRI